MRNLRNVKYSTWRSPPEHQERQITASTWDTLNQDSIICAYGPSENDTLIQLVRIKNGLKSTEHDLLAAWDAPSPTSELSRDKILNLHYFGDSLTSCLVLAGGDIVVVREEPLSGEDRIEIVGSVNAGVSAAAWSPDEELLAITTKAGTVVFMSRAYEGIMDVSMTSDDFKASNHVSVGWGKSETQFKGKGVKALRDPTMPSRTDQGILSLKDDGQTTISWRGDGAYIAISVIEGESRRLIRIYSRDGVLDSVSEPVDGLEGALSWRPAGNLIAGIQRFSDRVDVVFFERNGLRHGQFSLRLTQEELENSAKAIALSWNNDSSVLAIKLAKSVQLWTMGNYHWYLKQELPLASCTPLPLAWHPEKALLLLLSTPESIISVEYVFSVARGFTTPPSDFGVVAVIDGNTLRVTPFRFANVPPPMSLYDVSVMHGIVDVAFNVDASSIAVLHQGGIALFSRNITSTSTSPDLNGQFTFTPEVLESGSFQQICFGENDDVLTLQYIDGSAPTIKTYGFDDDTGRVEEKMPTNTNTASVVMISAFGDGNSIHPFAQGQSGDLHSLILGDTSLAECSFPLFLPWVEITEFTTGKIAFGLSANGYLYANSRLLVKNCSSFLLTPAHLVFTTTNHLLKFVHITKVEELEIPPDDPEKDERCRSIERGARLITTMPTSLSLVMQMPRGNLETIYPRAMVVAGIRELIEAKNYRKAFLHCRTQRVDLNFLFDHAPEQFLSNVELFIDQVKKIAHIDLFLSGLREEDVATSMYKETRVPPNLEAKLVMTNASKEMLSPVTAGNSKVNRICDAVLGVLKTRTATNLQNIITANVCKLPPALEDGLEVVARLMSENDTMAEKAVEHICFLADINKLYDTALGLYNLDLALLVAQQSQKDPREYLPFLQKLKEMVPLRRQFAIDDYLGRNSKALSHLYKLTQHDSTELELYTLKHSLYQDALKLCQYQSERLRTIMSLYATYLQTQSNFYEAAITFEFLRNYEKATSCYQRASPVYWQECLFCSSQQNPPLSGDSLAALATTLADSLVEAKDYQSAATIYLTYLASPSTALTLLCKGYQFAAALHLAAIHQPELLAAGGLIDTGLTDALSSSTDLLAECKSQLLAQVPRIRELRTAAATNPLAIYDGEANQDIPDDISVAASSNLSTSASLFTRYTGRQSQGTAATGVSRQTSKNRRREERKRARGKKGTVYEEEYLIASVGRLVERVQNVREEVRRLVVGLVRRGMRERAAAIEGLLSEVLDMCKSAVADVYAGPESAESHAKQTTRIDDFKPIGGDAVLAESIEAAGTRKIAPEIAALERLALLGG